MSKTADEFVGLVNTGDEEISITRVQSPRDGWASVQYSDYGDIALCSPEFSTPNTLMGSPIFKPASVRRQARRVGPLFNARSRRRRLHDCLRTRLLARQRAPRRMSGALPRPSQCATPALAVVNAED